MRIPPEVAEALIARWPVARLATLRIDGSAALVPVVFAASGGALWSPVDAKPKARGELARLRHVELDPRVSLLLDAWHDDWSRLWWLRLEGRAALVRAPDPEADPAVRAAAAALRAKYPQYARTALFHGLPTLLRIEVERRASWCAGPEALRGAATAGPDRGGGRAR